MSSNSKKLPFYLLIITIALFVILFSHITYMVITNTKSVKYNNPIVSSTVVRGEITDRNGKLLAIQTSKYNLYFRLKEIDDLSSAALFISPYINIPSLTVREK